MLHMLNREDIENCRDLGDSYLDIQKTRVAMELRLYQMENKHLVKAGLATKVTVNEPEPLKEPQEDLVDEEGHIKELETADLGKEIAKVEDEDCPEPACPAGKRKK